MKIAILSNTLNPHMKPLADEMYKLIGSEFKYIAGRSIGDERKNIGWSYGSDAPYLLNMEVESHKKEISHIIEHYDAVVFGANPYMYQNIAERIASGRLTYLFTERLFKRSIVQLIYPPRALMIQKQRVLTSWMKNVRILAASAYVAWDYHRIGANTSHIYKMGYHVRKSNFAKDDVQKNTNSLHMVCLGRFLAYKHFDEAIRLIRKLNDSGVNAYLQIAGSGPSEKKWKKLSEKLALKDRVCFCGSLYVEDVEKFLRESDVMLFTSGFGEGWGVVLNEAMANGCAIIASDAAGSTPWLIKDAQNGYIYKHGSIDSLFSKTMKLIENKETVSSIRQRAIETIHDEWNASIAAERLTDVISRELSGNTFFYNDGIMSKAPIIKNNFYH